MILEHFRPQEEIILTANARLARHLINEFDQLQVKAGLTSWEAPSIMPLSRWVEAQFYAHNAEGLFLLTAFQTQCLWEEVVTTETNPEILINPAEAATLAAQAFILLQQCETPLSALDPFREKSETHCLIRWVEVFTAHLTKNKQITQDALPAYLSQKSLTLPKKIHLTGFDELNGNIKTLIKHIEKTTPVAIEAQRNIKNSKSSVQLQDTEDELYTMARFAKKQLLDNPNARIGCIIPHLNNLKTKVARIFREVFSSSEMFSKNDHLFNISAGNPLSDHAMIQTAFSLLHWCKTPLPIDNTATLLQSHYLWTSEKEKNNGAKIDVRLRKENLLIVPFQKILAFLPQWQSFYTYYREIKFKKLSPSGWTPHFIQLLEAAHWPAMRSQTSEEYQLFERFKKLLQEFSHLDCVMQPLSYGDALHTLKNLAGNTLFQPKSHNEPIQIMGALEASGLHFDAAWVMSMDSKTWPAQTKPHPLIPYAVQKAYNMPHATPQRELTFCQHITHRLANSAPHVIFSSPLKSGEEDCTPSGLISAFCKITRDDLMLPAEIEKVFENIKESIKDDQAPAFTEASSGGGSSILSYQASCPFRAFAMIRLNAKSLETPKLGIPKRQQGSLVHQALFYLWGALEDKNKLDALSESDKNLLIENAIDRAAEDLSLSQHAFFPIERKRLLTLLSAWLEYEKTRPYFRVSERETKHTVTIGNLSTNIRQDRIDVLADGTSLIIDYKTSKKAKTTSDWFKERFEETQLPLYVVSNPNIQGVAYANITHNPKERKLNGILHENCSAADKKELVSINYYKNTLDIHSWDTLVTYWTNTLEKTADDFCKGIAKVDPIDTQVCQRCGLQNLCRLV